MGSGNSKAIMLQKGQLAWNSAEIASLGLPTWPAGFAQELTPLAVHTQLFTVSVSALAPTSPPTLSYFSVCRQ